MKKCTITLFVILLFATRVHGEYYQYTDKDGVIHFTDNKSNVPEDKEYQTKKYNEDADKKSNVPEVKKSQADDYEQELAIARSGPPSNANNLVYSHLSETDKCFFKLLTNKGGGTDPDSFKDTGISQENFDLLKGMLQKKYGLNEQAVCALLIPDPRFSSPESTWELYKGALMRGDPGLALECFSLDSKMKYSEVFSALGRDQMKQMAAEMRPIQKIKQDAASAKYRIRRDQQGQDITYYIYFNNLSGNWRIQQF